MTFVMECECCGKTAVKPDYNDWISVTTADPGDREWSHVCSWLCLLGLAIEEGQLVPGEIVDVLLGCSPDALEQMARAAEGRAT